MKATPIIKAVIGKSYITLLRPFATSDKGFWRASRWVLSRDANAYRPKLYKTAEGLNLELYTSKYPDGPILFGVFEITTIRLLRRLLTKGDHAIDVGGNIGYLACIMASLVGDIGEVHVIEPGNHNLAVLKRHIYINGFNNITIYPVAAGSLKEIVKLYSPSGECDSTDPQASLKPFKKNNKHAEVQMAPLDDIISCAPKVIKIDVEGAELGVIIGAQNLINAYRPHLIIELNHERLKAFGYTFGDVYDAIHSCYPHYQLHAINGFQRSIKTNNRWWEILPNGNYWFRP